MKLQELRDALAAARIVKIVDGWVRIGTVSIETPSFREILAPFCRVSGIEIADVQPGESTDREVVIQGRTSSPGLQEFAGGSPRALLKGAVDSVVTFEAMGDGTLGLTLSFELPAGWHFADSFPDLPLLMNADREESVVDGLKLRSSCFFLTTHQHEHRLGDGTKVALEMGLNFAGRWVADGMLGLFESLARGDSGRERLLYGPVVPWMGNPLWSLDDDRLPWDVRHRMPGIHLRADLGYEAAFPSQGVQGMKLTNLGFHIYTPCSGSTSTDEASHDPEMAFAGDLIIPSIDKNKLATMKAAKRLNSGDEMVIAGRFDRLTVGNLATGLKDLVGSGDAIKVLPETVRDGIGALGLRSASITLLRAGGGYEVGSVHFTIGMGADAPAWSPFGDPFENLVKIRFEALRIAVVRPFDGEQRAIFAKASGKTEFLGGDGHNGVTLDVQIDYPGWYVSATQSGTTKVDMRAFQARGMRLPEFLSFEFEIANIALAAEPGAYYAFSLNLARGQSWKIDATHSLPNLRLAVTCRTPAEGGPHFDWQFEASTSPDEGVPVGGLMGKMFKELGLDLPTLPGAIQGLSVERLAVSYSSRSGDFGFECRGTLPLSGGQKLDCCFTVARNQAASELRFGGEILLVPAGMEPLCFSLQFVKGQDSQYCLAAYNDRYGYSLKIRNVAESISPELGGFIPSSLEVSLKSALLAYGPEGILFAVDLGAKIQLSDLPLVGGALPKDQPVGLESLRVIAASAPFSRQSVDGLNRLLPTGVQPLSARAPAGDDGNALDKGFTVSAALVLGKTPYTLALPVGAGGTQAVRAPETGGGMVRADGLPPSTSAVDDAATKWFEIDKMLGPVSIRRIGLGYEEGRVGVKFDAGLQMSILTFSLNGLGVSYPLDKFTSPAEFLEHVEFRLDGMDLSYRSGPLSISGGFSKSELTVQGKKMVQYDGMALIQAANFAIAGFGSYAAIEGQTSLFVFAILHAELGGPPCFRVNGLAAGFGYNRKLILPPIEEVGNFPLVRAALDAGYFGGTDPKSSIRGAMERLSHYLPPSGGEYWFAIGIRFNSFEMLQSFALLSVSFGQEVEIGLLGLSMMSLPRGVKPGSEIAYAELAIRAVINLGEGSIQVEGRLTDESYIFSKECRITGGFAFYTWLSGPHAGDFVVTLGGYHPAFRRPAHYPLVPRLGVNWQVTPELAIKAEMYFALTPSCLMAGGRLSAAYESGVIRAWFVAHADFLLSWKPFYYTVDMGVSLGVEVDLSLFSIKAHLQVQLQLWGPEFGGQIDVDLTIFSFTVRFGPGKTLPDPLTADQFVTTFLPQQKAETLTASLAAGLLRQEKDGDREIRVVNGHAVEVMVQSLIPVTTFDGLGPKTLPAASTRFGVKPMGRTQLDSKLTVSLSNFTNHRDNLRVEWVETGVPEALWGPAISEGRVALPAKPEATILPARTGLRISFAPLHPQGALPPMDIDRFEYTTFEKPIPWDDRLKSAPPLEAGEAPGESIATVMSPTTTTRRDAVLKVLARQSPFALNTVDLTGLVAAGEAYFQENPKLCRLGSLNESIA